MAENHEFTGAPSTHDGLSMADREFEEQYARLGRPVGPAHPARLNDPANDISPTIAAKLSRCNEIARAQHQKTLDEIKTPRYPPLRPYMTSEDELILHSRWFNKPACAAAGYLYSLNS
jgi:hypothetical protein